MKQNEDIVKTIIENVSLLKVKKMIFLDPKQLKNVYIKSQECDLVILVNDEYIVNIEMDNGNNTIKNHFYSTDLMVNQLEKGEDYKEIKPVIQIVLANYNHFEKTNGGKDKVVFMDDVYKQIDNLFLEKWIICLPQIKKGVIIR